MYQIDNFSLGHSFLIDLYPLLLFPNSVLVQLVLQLCVWIRSIYIGHPFPHSLTDLLTLPATARGAVLV